MKVFESLSIFFFNVQALAVALLEKAIACNICAFILFSPFNNVFSKISFFWSSIFWISLSVIQHRSKFYRYLIPNTPLNKSLFVFLAVALISVVLSVDPYHSQKIFFQRYLFYVIFFWISYALVSRSRRNILCFVFSTLALGTVIGLGGLVDYFRFHPERLLSVFGKQVNLAIYLCFLFPFNFIVLLKQARRSFRVWSFVNIALLYPALILHASRTVWIAIIPIVLVICLLKDRKFFLFFLVVVIATPIFMSNLQKSRVRTLLCIFEPTASGKPVTFDERVISLTKRGDSLSERIHLVQSAIAIFTKNPIFGSGPGTFEKLYRPSLGYFQHLHVHVIYLEVLAEMGLIGLVAFLSIMVIFLKRFIHRFKLWLLNNSCENTVLVGAGSAVFTVLLCNLGISSILIGFQDSLLFWFFMAIAVHEKVFDANNFCREKPPKDLV